MSYQIDITEEAVKDLKTITDYLSKVSLDYATTLLDHITEYLYQLAERPRLFAKVRSNYYRLFLKTFQYHLIYAIDGEVVRIIAIVHDSRHSERWISVTGEK